MTEPTCKRCGLCCYLVDKDSNQTKKKCKYLIPMGNNRYACRIYKTRLGKIIGEVNGYKNRCIRREDSSLDYYGCPYNKENVEVDKDGKKT